MDAVYDKYYDQIYSWSISKTNNKEDAEDLTNNIFLALFEYFNKNINVDKLENLIWKIAYNIWSTKAKNYIKEKVNVEFDEKTINNSEIDMLDKIIYREIVDSIDKIGLTEKEIKSKFLKQLNISIISSPASLPILRFSNVLCFSPNFFPYVVA